MSSFWIAWVMLSALTWWSGREWDRCEYENRWADWWAWVPVRLKLAETLALWMVLGLISHS